MSVKKLCLAAKVYLEHVPIVLDTAEEDSRPLPGVSAPNELQQLNLAATEFRPMYSTSNQPRPSVVSPQRQPSLDQYP